MKFAVIALVVSLGSRAMTAPPPLVNEPSRKLSVADALELIQTCAEKHGVAATFVRSIVAAESNYDSDAISPVGAIGLMQLMPATAEELGADPTDPAQNVDAGTRYLRFLMDRYSNQRDSLKRVIAAYNAGPGNVDRYRGVPPFRETRTYVKRVMENLHRFEGKPARGSITLAMLDTE